jgi:protein transport protein SEC61 subunit beta
MPAKRSSKSRGARGSSCTNAATRRAARGGTVGQRTTTSSATAGSARKMFYTQDSPGIKVGPVPVLVMALLFITSVFTLHIWGRYVRS